MTDNPNPFLLVNDLYKNAINGFKNTNWDEIPMKFEV